MHHIILTILKLMLDKTDKTWCGISRYKNRLHFHQGLQNYEECYAHLTPVLISDFHQTNLNHLNSVNLHSLYEFHNEYKFKGSNLISSMENWDLMVFNASEPTYHIEQAFRSSELHHNPLNDSLVTYFLYTYECFTYIDTLVIT